VRGDISTTWAERDICLNDAVGHSGHDLFSSLPTPARNSKQTVGGEVAGSDPRTHRRQFHECFFLTIIPVPAASSLLSDELMVGCLMRSCLLALRAVFL
jgi:hypothetical protein